MISLTPSLRLPAVVDPDHLVWIFDLDNTLYPPRCNLFQQVDHRMTAFIAEFLKLDLETARTKQKHFYRTYGTTLRGMMTEHEMHPDDFLSYVHDIDLASVPADPALARAIDALPGKRYVFTNGSERHALNVTGKLGITDHFHGFFDIAAAGYQPKPDLACYRLFLGRFQIDPTRSVMFEDLPRNLVPAHSLGITTVLVRGTHELTEIDAEGDHIHHTTDDLTGWLESAKAHTLAPR